MCGVGVHLCIWLVRLAVAYDDCLYLYPYVPLWCLCVVWSVSACVVYVCICVCLVCGGCVHTCMCLDVYVCAACVYAWM